MAREEIKGAVAATTLNGAINNSVTSFTVTDGTGWPTGSPGPFVATIDRGLATEEKVLVTTRSTNTFSSVTRGYDGTSAQSHANGAAIEHTISAALLDEANRVVSERQGNVGLASAATVASQSKVTGDSNPRYKRQTDGQMEWGGGSGALDVLLKRLAADQLELQDEMRFTRSAAASLGNSTRVTGDTQDRHEVQADGKHIWGPGNAALDTNLYRLSADKLKTDDAFEVGAAFTALSTAAVTGLLTGSNLKSGSGTPEGAVTAGVGSVFGRTDGGSGTSLYVKESGAGNTGWTAVGASRNATLGKSYADVTSATSGSFVDIVTQAVAAGAIAAGECLRLTAWGDMAATTGPSNLDLGLKLDTTQVATSTSLATSSNPNTSKFYIEYLIAFPTISTQRIRGQGWVAPSTVIGANDIDTTTPIGVDATSSIDFTAGKNVILQLKQSAAGTLTVRGWLLERVSG